MKIAFLSLCSGHVDRGVETWTREMATRLKKKGHDVLVLQGSDEKVKRIYGSQIIRTRILWKIRGGESLLSQILSCPYWFSLNLSFTIRSLIPLIRFKPDIVMPTNGGIQTLIIRILSKVFGWKMVVTGHAGLGAPDKWNILMRPDAFVSPSKRGLDWAKRLPYVNRENAFHIPHGIDLKKFSTDKARVRIDLERPVVLCVSSFDPYKRVNLTIDAVSRMKKGSLLVIGGDRASGRLDKMAMNLLGDKRYKRIKVKPTGIPKYYLSSDLFTLPSNEYEAFGIVYLEALASNLPVVATNDELRQEIVGNAGILVDPTDIDEYKSALEKAFKTDWGNKPRKQAEKFSWNNTIDSYEELFSNL